MQKTAAALLLVSTLVTGACSNPAPGSAATSAEGLHGTNWSLTSWEGRSDSEHLRRVQMSFEGNNISGEGPCNRYDASFTLQDGKLELGPVAATKRGCEAERMQLESAWFAALAKLDRLELDGNSMVLSGADGTRLSFTRSNESPTKP